MFHWLSYKPYEHMAVEHHVFELEIFLVFVLVNEGSFKLSLLSDIEFLDLDLLGEIHPVLGHSLEDCLLCTPVYCKLLILLLVVKVVYLFL